MHNDYLRMLFAGVLTGITIPFATILSAKLGISDPFFIEIAGNEWYFEAWHFFNRRLKHDSKISNLVYSNNKNIPFALFERGVTSVPAIVVSIGLMCSPVHVSGLNEIYNGKNIISSANVILVEEVK